MKMKTFLILLLMIWIPAHLFAQADQDTRWQIVERCLPEPVLPDEAWSLDGEILLRGWAGIHGVSAEVDTPYVLHWGGGWLSPDSRWLLRQSHTTEMEHLSGPGAMARYHLYYDDIIVINLETGEQRIFPWDGYATFTSGPYLFGPEGPIWLDDTHFMSFYGYYGETKIGNVETGEITVWEGVPMGDAEYAISPDGTRVITRGFLFDATTSRRVQEEQVGRDKDFISPVWSDDSTLFAEVTSGEEIYHENLPLYDRDGNLLGIPYTSGGLNLSLGAWSPTNEYFSFSASGYVAVGDYRQQNFILDIRNKVIYDLCIPEQLSMAWSPDGTQFAAISGGGQQPVIVVDMENWQPRIIAYHTGSVIRWR